MPSPLRIAAAGAGVVLAALVAVLALGLLHPPTRLAADLRGQPAPALAVATADGRTVAVADFQGRPLVLNFWASWCDPCRQEAAPLAAAAHDHPGVAFLGAAMQDTEAGSRTFVERYAVPYPAGPITSGSYLRYGVTGPPETFFLGPDGRIRERFIGPLDRATLEAYIARLTGAGG